MQTADQHKINTQVALLMIKRIVLVQGFYEIQQQDFSFYLDTLYLYLICVCVCHVIMFGKKFMIVTLFS